MNRFEKSQATEMATKKCPVCQFEVGHHPNCPEA